MLRVSLRNQRSLEGRRQTVARGLGRRRHKRRLRAAVKEGARPRLMLSPVLNNRPTAYRIIN